MKFGVYVHIPYCLQRCPYCDFATYDISTVETGAIRGPNDYLECLLREIQLRAPFIPHKQIDTVYFGGGTPSLLDPDSLIRVLSELRNQGFQIKPDAEITMEINPATLDPDKIERSIRGGFNRFSVGAQSFSDRLLKIAGRRHSAQDTIDTLRLLTGFKVNYSFDLLFALPSQTLDDLRADLENVQKFSPPHVSAYCLTVPESNPMSKGRPVEGVQVEMFHLINRDLALSGLRRYEISNFSKPGFESQHNLIYWNDDPYWGVGLSAHSYLHLNGSPSRFWNPNRMATYFDQINQEHLLKTPLSLLQKDHSETLLPHEYLTDFCHTSLRKTEGLLRSDLIQRFSGEVLQIVLSRAQKSIRNGLLKEDSRGWHLSEEGWLLSNLVFQEMTFSAPEVASHRVDSTTTAHIM